MQASSHKTVHHSGADIGEAVDKNAVPDRRQVIHNFPHPFRASSTEGFNAMKSFKNKYLGVF
jgi:hypothetical protein